MGLRARGKFLFLDSENNEGKFFLKATPTFDPGEFVADGGFNTVWLNRPTLSLLDECHRQGVKVVAHFDLQYSLDELFAGDEKAPQRWRENLRCQAKNLLSHPALIAFDLGQPFAAPIRAWFGDQRLEHELHLAFQIVKALDPNCPVTYTTSVEQAQIGMKFLDFFTVQFQFETLSVFRAQLSRLQNLIGGFPLIVRSFGVDQTRPEEEQVNDMVQLITMTFNAGCAGCILADTTLRPLVSHTLEEAPFPSHRTWPKISVVICVYNAKDTIEECLDGTSKLEYPELEVIIVNDGSTDETLSLVEPKAEKYGFRIVNLEVNGGLSQARNRGMHAATGEFIAYLDGDAFPDVHWLKYLAITFLSTKHAVIGGPNLSPLSTGRMADCIDQAPGNPQIVLIDDETADHIPGCNLAVRRSFMLSIGGFNMSYRGGGDDVNFCWQVIKLGATLGFSHGAMVWHYRRPTIGSFLRQQIGYGKGEAALERDWPARFNSLGHQTRIKQRSTTADEPKQLLKARVYQSSIGESSALGFWLNVFPSMPEWPFFLISFALLTGLGLRWHEFLIFAPVLALGVTIWIWRAILAGIQARLRFPSFGSRALVSFLYLAQPLARLRGRLAGGLTPWRGRCENKIMFPLWRIVQIQVHPELSIKEALGIFSRGVDTARLPAIADEGNWDWQIEGGLWGGTRCLLNVGTGQLTARIRPYVGDATLFIGGLILLCVAMALGAQAWFLAGFFTFLFLILAERVFSHMSAATAGLLQVFNNDKFATYSLWQKVQPPRHFFEKPGGK